MIRRATIPLFCLALAVPALAQSVEKEIWEAKILRIVDGDTAVVRRTENGKQVRIRLYGINAPEMPDLQWKRQPYGRAAKDFLEKMLPFGSRVMVEAMGRDRYNRAVALISLPDGNQVQEELLRAGLAWVYPQHCTLRAVCDGYRALEQEAKQAERGLWADMQPVPPWEWRKTQKH